MPLPDEPTSLEGGCNCGAVRYRISVPATDERPVYPGGGMDTDPPTRMPFACIDHCNDCRSATGAVLPCWLLTPMNMVSVSLVAKSSKLSDGRLDATTTRGPWLPANDIFQAQEADQNSFLSFFASSPSRRRSFCSRCGTMFAYCAFPTPASHGFAMLDLVLGTIDKSYLEKADLKPERQLWWKLGINWVQELSRDGLKVPIFPGWKVTDEISIA